MITSNSSLTPSTQRPIPLLAREDLKFKRIDYLGVGYWVVKEPVGLKYYRLQPEQYHTLWLLDAKRSLEQIRDELQKELPTVRLQLSDIQHLITDLHEKGLAYSRRPGQGASLIKHHREQRKKKILNTMRSLLYLRLPGWDPETTLQLMYPFLRWIFRPWCVFLTIAFVMSSWVLLGVQFETFRLQLPEFQQFFGWPNLLYLWVTLATAKIIHEFGHGLSCKHFGGECHEMGMMLLVFSPCLYCDVTDSWMLKNKWHRITIGGAGMYIEIFLSAIAIYVWWYSEPGLLHHLALNVFFVTTVTTVIFNANPLMRFDGYYMMSDFLEIPNLRPKSDRLMRESFAWYCLGIESKPDPFMPETGRVWFVLFAICAWLYRWVILASITIFLYTVLKPYGLQSIGISLAVVSISTIFGNMFFNVYKLVTAPRIEPMSRPKIAATLTVLVCVVVAVLAIPIPWHVEASFIIEPYGVRHVYTTTNGELVEIYVTPGQRVKRRDRLAMFKNEDMEDQIRELEVQKNIYATVLIEMYHEAQDFNQEELAKAKLKSISDQLDDLKLQQEQLIVRAVCDGTVVAAPRVPEPPLEQKKSRLGSWHGTLLDKKNIGCLVEERSHLLSIAPNRNYQAVLLVDQGDIGDIGVNKAVDIKFDHLADITYEGIVDQISDRPLEFVPELLSNKTGGELPTMTDSQGREQLMSPAYQTTVLLTKDTPLLKSGMRGRARFLVDHRSIGKWIWRYLNRTFRFRL